MPVIGAIISDNFLHGPYWHELAVVAACAGVLGAIGTLIGRKLQKAAEV